jgi:uncharacterized hydrophobic protein (TIGR00271 family)
VIHVRVVVPENETAGLLAALEQRLAVHNIIVLAGVARRPDGDLLQFDVASEATNEILAFLRSCDLHRNGSITIDRIDMALSDSAELAEELAPGDSNEAVIWEEVESRVRGDSSITVTYLALMTVAVLIAAVGILLDSTVLIVGSMVVGPDFGPLSGVILGLHRKRFARAGTAARTLTVGFVAGIVLSIALVVCVRVFGRVPDGYLSGIRPATSFISKPDGWSVIIAALAAIAGTLSLIEAKAGPMVGVLISVTTVPAAANVAVALSLGKSGEALGALGQLLVNLAVMVLVGVATLQLSQRFLHRHHSQGHAQL